MLHAKVVAHFVGHGRGHEAHHRAVVHRNPTGKLIGAHGAFDGLAHDSTLELDPPETNENKKQ